MNGRLQELSRTQTFILAGGQGKRLHPLTVSLPKPAVSFGGMFRIIDFTLSNCLHSGLSRVALLTQYRHEVLDRHVREAWSDLWNNTSVEREPIACLAPASGQVYRGTADAVFRNAGILDAASEYVLILSGDHIYQMDYRDLLRQHADTNADLTIATVEHPLREASHFGVVQVDENFRVTGFEEKPLNPRPLPSDSSQALVSMGVYVFKKTVLIHSLRALCERGSGYDFGHDVIPALIASSRTYAYHFRNKNRSTSGYWRDIGTIDAYYAASMDLVHRDAPFDLDGLPSQPRRHPSLNRPIPRTKNARHRSDCRVTRSVLSPGVHLGQGATVYESVLMPNVRIGKGARLKRAIVEEGVWLPAGYHAGFDLEHDRRHHNVTDKGVVVISESPRKTRPTVVHFAHIDAMANTGNNTYLNYDSCGHSRSGCSELA